MQRTKADLLKASRYAASIAKTVLTISWGLLAFTLISFVRGEFAVSAIDGMINVLLCRVSSFFYNASRELLDEYAEKCVDEEDSKESWKDRLEKARQKQNKI